MVSDVGRLWNVLKRLRLFDPRGANRSVKWHSAFRNKNHLVGWNGAFILHKIKIFFFWSSHKEEFPVAILYYSSEQVTPANNLYKQRQWKKPFCLVEGTSFIPIQTVLQAAAHTADIHGNKEEAQIEECRFEQKSITNNVNCFLDSSWGIRQFPKLFQTGMSCWFYRNLCGQFTLGIGFCSSGQCTWTGGKEVTVGSYPSPALISCLIRNLLSTETTAPYNPMS